MSGKNLLKRIGAVALSAVMALSVVGAAFAETGRVTFENTYEPQPDLYVYKTVDTAVDGYYAPDVDFTFQVRYDSDGDGYMENYADKAYVILDSTGNKVSEGKTDATGHFTLKAGQYAYFEFFGQYDYEIIETPADSFTQTEPAGGSSATGTVPKEGTVVTFNNTYIPDIPSETTDLIIRKDIAWPDGFEAQDISTEFTFEVSIDGSPYANQWYTLYSDTSRTEQTGSGMTDGNGQLTIQGGQTAVFTDIEVGLDYEVSEVSGTDGWHAVGQTQYVGSTTSSIVYAYFANEPTWFSVGKERYDGSISDSTEFTYTLTGTDGTTPLTGVTYYVYDSESNFVDTGTTGENGTFTLIGGQTALFIGLAENTKYTLTETAVNGYEINDIVISGKGDAVKGESGTVTGTASYDGNSIVYVNEELTAITIKKLNASNTDEALKGAGFTLYKLKDGVDADNATDSDWEQVGDEQTTSEDGTTVFNVSAGTYKIAETTTPAGYVALGEDIIVTVPYNIDNPPAEGNRYVYSDRDGTYYLFDLTYDVTNQAVLQLPNTGSFPWQWVALGVVLAIAGVTTVLYVRKTRRESEAV